MAVTYRPRKRAVPYKTRLTGRLILKTRGSAHHAGPFASLVGGILLGLEVGDNARGNNPIRTVPAPALTIRLKAIP